METEVSFTLLEILMPYFHKKLRDVGVVFSQLRFFSVCMFLFPLAWELEEIAVFPASNRKVTPPMTDEVLRTEGKALADF